MRYRYITPTLTLIQHDPLIRIYAQTRQDRHVVLVDANARRRAAVVHRHVDLYHGCISVCTGL